MPGAPQHAAWSSHGDHGRSFITAWHHRQLLSTTGVGFADAADPIAAAALGAIERGIGAMHRGRQIGTRERRDADADGEAERLSLDIDRKRGDG